MIKLIDLEKLKIHEKVSQTRLAEVKKMIVSAYPAPTEEF